jgi:hypothetical protein
LRYRIEDGQVNAVHKPRPRWINVDFLGLPEYLWPVIFTQSSWISFRVRTRWSLGSFNGGGAGSSLARRCATRLERLVAPFAPVVGTTAVEASTGLLLWFLQTQTQKFCNHKHTMFSTMEIYNNSIHYTLDTQLISDIIGNLTLTPSLKTQFNLVI